MNELHSLLKQQLRRFANDAKPFLEENSDFIQAINDVYLQFDADRRMLERDLELTAQELLERNTELSHINRELEMRVAARTAELSSNEARFRGLFEYAPVSIWEEDFSAARQYIDELRDMGVENFSAYFDEHPEDLAECARRVKIVDVNRATLEMYQAESKEQLLADLSQVLGPESLTAFKEELLAMIRGDMIFETELFNYTLRGEKRVVFLRLTVAPGFEKTWEKVFVGISDITERRQAETALAVERDLLQALMDNIPDTIYFKDTASRFTRINRAQVKVLGVATPEEAIGKTDFDFFPATELAKGFFEEEQQIVKSGESLTNRIQFIPAVDGQPRWFAATKVPIKDDNGNVIGIVGVSRDITALKKAEDALRETEIKYRTLVENLPAIVYLDEYDPAIPTRYRPVYMSPQVEIILGYRPEEFIENPGLWPSLLHPDDRQPTLDAEGWHYHAGEPLHQEYRVIGRDGRVVWLRDEAVMIKEEASGKAYSQGVLLDITARKMAEEALRQSEERFRLMAWATKDAVWDWDLLTNQIWWGSGLQKIFHYSAQTNQTSPEWWRSHIHPDDRAKVDRTLNQALETGMEFWSKEYRFQRINGTYADIMDRGYILHDNTGKPYRMIGAMMDITERKQAEMALQEANEKMALSLSELELRNNEIVLLNEMSDLLQSSTEKAAHTIIGDAARRLFPGTSGAFYLFNTAHTHVNMVTSWGDPPPVARTFVSDDCWALRRGQTHQLYEDEDKPPCNHILEPLPAVTYCLPMVAQGEILGVFHLQSPSKDHLTEPKRQLTYTVVEQAGMALSNLKLREALREQSIRDPLTGLYNRRYMEEVLKQHLRRVTRHLHPLGIIMIDIDDFKHFNDTNGHAAGDALLRELGGFLQRRIRGEDVACRYGGEEFILIMPEAFLEAAYQRAELLRQGAKGLRVSDAGQSFGGITLSVGVAIYPQHGRTIDSILRAADTALYRAKQEGRDRVVVAENVE